MAFASGRQDFSPCQSFLARYFGGTHRMDCRSLEPPLTESKAPPDASDRGNRWASGNAARTRAKIARPRNRMLLRRRSLLQGIASFYPIVRHQEEVVPCSASLLLPQLSRRF